MGAVEADLNRHQAEIDEDERKERFIESRAERFIAGMNKSHEFEEYTFIDDVLPAIQDREDAQQAIEARDFKKLDDIIDDEIRNQAYKYAEYEFEQDGEELEPWDV